MRILAKTKELVEARVTASEARTRQIDRIVDNNASRMRRLNQNRRKKSKKGVEKRAEEKLQDSIDNIVKCQVVIAKSQQKLVGCFNHAYNI